MKCKKNNLHYFKFAICWCSGWFYVFNFIDWCNLFFQHHLRSLSAKNANHLQTTDTLKRHRRYSIHYHCGWPSLGIWGSATHYGLPALPEPLLRACSLHRVCTGLKKNQNSRAVLACLWFAQGLHKAQKNQNSRAVLWCSWWFYVFNFIDWCNLFFSTSLKGIIRKECQSFTNHGHAKTPPAAFNPLSLWLTLPRDMGVSHTLWPPSIARAILACLCFAQGLHKAQKNQNSRTVLWCSGWFYVFNFIDWCNLFFHVTKSNKGKSKCGGTLPGRGHKSARCRWNRLRRSSSGGDCLKSLITTSEDWEFVVAPCSGVQTFLLSPRLFRQSGGM